jgi:glycosyltransferase 2 family protein
VSMPRGRRRAWAWAQLLGAVLILALLVRQLGAGPFLTGLRGLGPGTLLAALAIGAATTVCSAWRWRVVAGALGVGLPLPAATAAYYRSQFLNSVLPGGVLGDVHRGVRHGLDAGDLGRGVRAVVWDRAAGQVVQVALTLIVLLALPSPVHASLPLVVPPCAAAAAVLLLVGRVLARRGSGRLSRLLRVIAVELRALLRRATWPTVLLSSVLVVGGYLGTFLLAAHAAGVPGSPLGWLPPAFVVLLASSIPFNVAGWGPREGAAVWVFAAAGLGAGTGVAVATAFGVLTLVSTLPGAAVLVADRRRRSRRPLSADPEPAWATGEVLSGT